MKGENSQTPSAPSPAIAVEAISTNRRLATTMPRSSAIMPRSRYSGMKRMTEVWKPRQARLPTMTIVTQTRTKMPYSNEPIQRAISTWLTKAMTALTMRMEKAMSDMRPASPRSSAVNSTASMRPSSGLMRSARRCGRNRPAVVAAEKRTRTISVFPPLFNLWVYPKHIKKAWVRSPSPRHYTGR